MGIISNGFRAESGMNAMRDEFLVEFRAYAIRPYIGIWSNVIRDEFLAEFRAYAIRPYNKYRSSI